MTTTREVIKVKHGVGQQIAKLYKVPAYRVARALNGTRTEGLNKAIRATAMESYGGVKVVITEEVINHK